jgi:hypothetical protein
LATVSVFFYFFFSSQKKKKKKNALCVVLRFTNTGLTAKTWSNVGGENVELEVESYVGTLLGPMCASQAASRAMDLVRVNGAAPAAAVQVNVIEAPAGATGAAQGPTSDTFAPAFVCYRYRSECPSDERIVVNIVVSEWCESDCVSSRDSAPTCFGDRGCVHGSCVDTNRCFCNSGYDGQRCATRSGCETTGCSGHGLCEPVAGSCSCAAGFEGDRCETRTATPKPTRPPVTPGQNGTLAPAAHGDALDADQSWLLPFHVFPEGNFSHFGVLSSGQLPHRINWKQNGREPLEQPLTTDEVNAQGYIALDVDYDTKTLTYEVVFTVPKGELATGQVGPVAELFNAQLGFTGAAVSELKGGYWCVVPSWVSLEWEAWKINGTLEFSAATAGALAESEIYAQIRTTDRPHGALRAQLIRFDSILTSKLQPASSNLDAQGAAVFFLDKQQSTLQYWVYYTTPLDYVERGATINDVATNNEVFPLALGTVGIRRVGPYDRTKNPPAQYVCALSKMGVFRFGGVTYGDAVAPRLAGGRFAINIASNDLRDGALLGVIAE